MADESGTAAPMSAFDEYAAFVDEFKAESDRAAVILGAAKLDSIMDQMVRRFLRSSPTGDDDLLDTERPLASMGAKISFLYRLGLIDNGVARSLHLIRKIRNGFAHEVSSSSLESGPHRDRVRELVSTMKSPFFRFIRRRLVRLPTGPATDFRTALAILVGCLEGHILNVDSVENFTKELVIRPPSFSDTKKYPLLKEYESE